MALRVACWTACAFAQLLPDKPPEEFINTPFGSTPKGNVLPYQALEYEKMAVHCFADCHIR